jgi:hypothetical protein
MVVSSGHHSSATNKHTQCMASDKKRACVHPCASLPLRVVQGTVGPVTACVWEPLDCEVGCSC